MRFIDSHLHLSDLGEPDVEAMMGTRTGTLLLSCSTDRRDSKSTVEIASRSRETVLAFVGVHPSKAGDEPDLRWLEQLLDKAAGVGEVGLDPRYSSTDRSGAQIATFEHQLRLAEKQSKPIQVHSRGAEEQCLQVLETFRLKSVLLHWFEGERLVLKALDRGYFISFGPALVYSKALKHMARAAGPSAVLSETDAPVRFAALGGASGPALVPSVVFALAEAWGTTFEEARVIVAQNAVDYLRPSGKG